LLKIRTGSEQASLNTIGLDTIGDVTRIAVFALAFCAAGISRAAQPIIDNERVTVWDITGTKDDPAATLRHDRDFVTVYLSGAAGGTHKKGDVLFAHSGVSKPAPGERTIVIELKDHPVAPLANHSGYPLAFPRPHVKKVLENDRIFVWSYAWNPGEPTPMHFHDKDVVVVYMEDTALKSTTPDGKSTINEYSAFQTKFNLRDRVHTELLVRGTGSAIMTELK
jgi:hypothetical protein